MQPGIEVKRHLRETYAALASKEYCCLTGSSEEATIIEEALSMGYSAAEITQVPKESLLGLGCGNPLALIEVKEGHAVLDLGSGAGMDAFLAAQKVGKTGHVIGVDMTEEMVQRANGIARHHGYENVNFVLGEIEHLPIEDETIDVIISNCVINLSASKGAPFQEVYRVLRPGGVAMVSDLVTMGEVSDQLRKSFAAWAGCIARTIEKQVYLNTIKEVGFHPVTVLSEKTFFELGLSKPLAGRIESIQIKARRPKEEN